MGAGNRGTVRYSWLWSEKSLKISARSGKVRVVGPCGEGHTFISIDAAKTTAARLVEVIMEAEAQQAKIEAMQREQTEVIFPAEEMLSVN
jgi:hypothetical protein